MRLESLLIFKSMPSRPWSRVGRAKRRGVNTMSANWRLTRFRGTKTRPQECGIGGRCVVEDSDQLEAALIEQAVQKLVLLGEQVNISPADMIRMLDAGMTAEELLTYVVSILVKQSA